jgi:hypothetical protein
MTLILKPQRYGYWDDRSPDDAGLRAFYGKYGFLEVGDGKMAREPNSQVLQAP